MDHLVGSAANATVLSIVALVLAVAVASQLERFLLGDVYLAWMELPSWKRMAIRFIYALTGLIAFGYPRVH